MVATTVKNRTGTLKCTSASEGSVNGGINARISLRKAHRQSDPDHTTQSGEDHTLGKKLVKELGTCCAECASNGDFLAARGASIFSFPAPRTCTTIAATGFDGGVLAGCGINASSPFGASGAITIKIIMMRTRSMSIKGTTLMVAIELPLAPSSIPIAVSLSGGLHDE